MVFLLVLGLRPRCPLTHWSENYLLAVCSVWLLLSQENFAHDILMRRQIDGKMCYDQLVRS
ncbi:hypothetical protein GLYMA_13G358400v4 [Glycine max]|uniref:Uncharacterized protein n=1 Tax=Glycine max TaxID=3847 RepID=A0A0R0GYK2_SOYBN|nr:hypothetical protein GYH30_038422 [Glycine max]KRH23457.1 hypothetical protein GLYMA_13G358400v4 [Glycine max]